MPARAALGLLIGLAASTAAAPTLSIPFSSQLLSSSPRRAHVTSATLLHFTPGARISPSHSFRIALLPSTFTSPSSSINCTAYISGTSALLPDWISFDPQDLTLKGVAPPDAQSLNTTILCWEPGKSGTVDDWLVIQVGRHALEASAMPPVIGGMIGNSLSFNATQLLQQAVVDGRYDPTVTSIVDTSAFSWLQWNSSENIVTGEVPDDDSLPAASLSLPYILQDQYNDTVNLQVPLSILPSYFTKRPLPPLSFQSMDTRRVDLHWYLRDPPGPQLTFSASVVSGSAPEIENWVSFNATTLVLTVSPEHWPLAKNEGGSEIGTILVTAHDNALGWTSNATIRLVDGNIVSHPASPPPGTNVYIAMICICSTLLIVAAVAFGIWIRARRRSRPTHKQLAIAEKRAPSVSSVVRTLPMRSLGEATPSGRGSPAQALDGSRRTSMSFGTPSSPVRAMTHARPTDELSPSTLYEEPLHRSKIAPFASPPFDRASRHSHTSPSMNPEPTLQAHHLGWISGDIDPAGRSPSRTSRLGASWRTPLTLLRPSRSLRSVRDRVLSSRTPSPQPRANSRPSSNDTAEDDIVAIIGGYDSLGKKERTLSGSSNGIPPGQKGEGINSSESDLDEVSRGMSTFESPLSDYLPNGFDVGGGDDTGYHSSSAMPSSRELTKSPGENSRIERNKVTFDLSDDSMMTDDIVPSMTSPDRKPEKGDPQPPKKISTSFSMGPLPLTREFYDSGDETSPSKTADKSAEFNMSPKWDFSLHSAQPSDLSPSESPFQLARALGRRTPSSPTKRGTISSGHSLPPIRFSARDLSKTWEY